MPTSTVARNLVLGVLLVLFVSSAAHASGTIHADHADRNWTRGCIAVSNEEMDEIWQLVADGTPVNIIP